MKVLVINGANLKALHKRGALYGNLSYDELCRVIKKHGEKFGITVDFFVSNHEGEIVDKILSINEEYHGVIINPGAYSHYSVAILDALLTLKIPVVEVHLTNPWNREEFRKTSVTAKAATGIISGFKEKSYLLALDFFGMKFEK